MIPFGGVQVHVRDVVVAPETVKPVAAGGTLLRRMAMLIATQ